MDGRRSLARIADAVNGCAPDVVCLQEVHKRLPQSGWANQPEQLERLLAMPVLFFACVPVPFGGYGVAVASRWPVVRVRRHALPGTGERRGALEATLQRPHGETITVFCTHWGLRDRERERQAAQLAQWVNGARSPVIVCGDFNEGPDGAAWQHLVRQTGLADAAENSGPTYPADAPRARIDAILCSPSLSVTGAGAVPTLASDHLPVWADFADGQEPGPGSFAGDGSPTRGPGLSRGQTGFPCAWAARKSRDARPCPQRWNRRQSSRPAAATGAGTPSAPPR